MTRSSETHVEARDEHHIDIHTTAGKLAELRTRSEETLHPVGEAAVDKVHAKGRLTARERIYALLDEGSFVELAALARTRVCFPSECRKKKKIPSCSIKREMKLKAVSRY